MRCMQLVGCCLSSSRKYCVHGVIVHKFPFIAGSTLTLRVNLPKILNFEVWQKKYCIGILNCLFFRIEIQNVSLQIKNLPKLTNLKQN